MVLEGSDHGEAHLERGLCMAGVSGAISIEGMLYLTEQAHIVSKKASEMLPSYFGEVSKDLVEYSIPGVVAATVGIASAFVARAVYRYYVPEMDR